MRIIIFSSGRIIDYSPFGGVENFGKTQKVGGNIIGEYYGDANEQELPTYTGEWPILKVSDFRKELTLREFILMLTPQELRLIEVKTKTDDDILMFWEIAKADRTIDLGDPVAVAGMAKLVDKNVLTQKRHDIIMLGVPL